MKNSERIENQISTEHVENNSAVRKMLIKRGVKPESLPPAEDVKKMQRRLDSEEKKIISGYKKTPITALFSS